MIIGIIGTRFAGKKTLSTILAKEYRFHQFIKCDTDYHVFDELIEQGWKKECLFVVILSCWQQVTIAPLSSQVVLSLAWIVGNLTKTSFLSSLVN